MKRVVAFLEWMLNPYIILLFFILGGLLGELYPDYSVQLAPFGDLFIDMLMMCVFPLMITAIASSLAHILRSHHVMSYFNRILCVFILSALIFALFGVVLASFGGLGDHLSDRTLNALGQIIQGGSADTPKTAPPELFQSFAPANLLKAFSAANNISIVSFAIIFGVALGYVTRRTGGGALKFIESIYHVMLKVITSIIYFLPYALLCIVASEVSALGVGVFYNLTRLIVFCYAGSILLVIVQLIITSFRLRLHFFFVLSAMKDALIVAFVTSNSFAVIPLAMKAFREKLNVDENKSNLFFPLGVTFNPQGTAFLIGLVSIYMMHLYGYSASLSDFLIIIFGSLLASLAIGGMPFVAGMSLLAIIFTPLDVPIQVFIVLMAALSNILDPIITVANISGNFMAVSLLPKDSGSIHPVLFPHKNLYK